MISLDFSRSPFTVLKAVTIALFTLDSVESQEIVKPGQPSQFLSEEAWKIYDAATDKLRSARDQCTHRAFKSGKLEIFPGSTNLLKGDVVWKSSFAVLKEAAPVSGNVLQLAGTGASQGDVVLIKSGSDVMPLVYVGDNRFPDSPKPYSFFIYPYSDRSGMELNTMPPRWTARLLSRNKILKEGEIGVGQDKHKAQFVTTEGMQGLSIRWLKKPPAPLKHFVPTRWWKSDATYTVLRPTKGASSDDFFKQLAKDLKCSAAALKAVTVVESGSGGFTGDKRPMLSLDGHVFWRNLSAAGWARDKLEELVEQNPGMIWEDIVANRPNGKNWPTYVKYYSSSEKGQDKVWTRFEKAKGLDESAAIRACAWGFGQIHGSNYVGLGFESPQEFVAEQSTADGQQRTFARFVKYTKLYLPLRESTSAAGGKVSLGKANFESFAKGYNGASYPPTYPALMEKEYLKLKAAGWD